MTEENTVVERELETKEKKLLKDLENLVPEKQLQELEASWRAQKEKPKQGSRIRIYLIDLLLLAESLGMLLGRFIDFPEENLVKTASLITVVVATLLFVRIGIICMAEQKKDKDQLLTYGNVSLLVKRKNAYIYDILALIFSVLYVLNGGIYILTFIFLVLAALFGGSNVIDVKEKIEIELHCLTSSTRYKYKR